MKRARLAQLARVYGSRFGFHLSAQQVADLQEWIMPTIEDQPAKGTPADPLREALAELVACKDMKDRIDAAHGKPVTVEIANLAADYECRKPWAWRAARAALATKPAEQPAAHEEHWMPLRAPFVHPTERGVGAVHPMPTVCTHNVPLNERCAKCDAGGNGRYGLHVGAVQPPACKWCCGTGRFSDHPCRFCGGAVQPPAPEPLTDEQIDRKVLTILAALNSREAWDAMTFESGPYSINRVKAWAMEFVRALTPPAAQPPAHVLSDIRTWAYRNEGETDAEALKRVRELIDVLLVQPPAPELLTERVWKCEIGAKVGELPGGADWPLRSAVMDAFKALTGYECEFIFSGWGAEVSPLERAVINESLSPRDRGEQQAGDK